MRTSLLPRYAMSFLYCLFLTCLGACQQDSDLLADLGYEEEAETSIDPKPDTEGETEKEGDSETDGDLEARTVAFPTANDAFSQKDGQSQEAKGYNEHLIRVEEDTRTGYLMFDLSAIEGTITAAELEFTVAGDEGHGVLTVFKALASDWDETSLDKKEMPDTDIDLGTLEKSFAIGATEIVPLEATEIQSEKITLILSLTDGNDFAIASKEHPSGDYPKLRVTYDAPKGSDEIVVETPEPGTETETRHVGFPSTQDAYLQDNTRYDQSLVRVEPNSRAGHLMFDLSPIKGSITGASLEFSITDDEGYGQIIVSKADNSSWKEGDADANNAPQQEVVLGDLDQTFSLGQTAKIDLDHTELSAEATTLILSMANGNDIALASKEHPNGLYPKLTITYEAAVGSDEITITEPEPDTAPPAGPAEEGAYYVTANGNASNNGLSEATAWSIEHAFKMAQAGDIVYIKAGNYGSKQLSVSNNGQPNNPIQFIGYTQTPGDLVSQGKSTFSYGDRLSADRMPLLSFNGSGTAFNITKNYVHLENIQITKYSKGVESSGIYVSLKNIIATELGNQNNYNAYDGWGIVAHADHFTLENSFVLNAVAEAIKLKGSSNSLVSNSEVRANNPNNPTDYYFLLTGGTKNTVVENSHAERTPGLKHGGHGFDMKDQAEYNTFKNCTAVNTNFELNFSGVRYNTIVDCKTIGVSSEASEWHAGLVIFNGANNNLIKNMLIENTWRAIAWGDYDDGYVGPGGDRDEVSMGYDNTFDGIVVRNADRIINVGGGDEFDAWAKRNKLINCSFSDFKYIAVTYYPTEDIVFENCTFTKGQNGVVEAQGKYAPYSKADFKFINCNWANVSFTPPN